MAVEAELSPRGLSTDYNKAFRELWLGRKAAA